MSTLESDLLDLIAEEAMVDRAKLVPSSRLADVGIDSIGFVSLIYSVEEKYNVIIETEHLTHAETLGQLTDLLHGLIGGTLNATKA